ncbi:MAG TPA: aldehyde dehydrogenase family protein [bacterium]|nr:aldehyde dehydrogenase family protein [bacterium]
MPLTDSEISEIVQKVLREIRRPDSRTQAALTLRRDAEKGREAGVFDTLDQAIEAAGRAQKSLLDLGLATRFEIIRRMRETARQSAELWARMAVEETGLGRVQDKYNKNLLCARKTPGPADLKNDSTSGDDGLTIVEPAPFGVVGVITPSTNPAATVINNAISLVSAGNACVFNPHPAAKHVCRAAAAALSDAIVQGGGPANVVTVLREPSQDSAAALIRHPGIDLLLVTGGMPVVRLAMASGKRAICAGPGNPPVVVDESAVIGKAARDIVTGASFDNNILCTDEKEIFVVDKVADALKRELAQQGGFEIKGADIDRVTALLVAEDPGGHGHRPVKIHREYAGSDLDVILARAGLTAPSRATLGFMEVAWDHPLVMAEQLLPILPLVRCRTFEEAMERAIIAEHGYHHTFVMHSTNITHLSAMAQNCNANIFVKNGPNMAGLGYGGEGYTTMSIAGTTGEGLTRASTFTRPRRCTLVDYFRIV